MEFETGELARSLLRRNLGEPLPHPVRLVSGNASEHKLVHALLRAAGQAPSYEDFLSWLDDPTYEPSDRLLVKRDGQIIAHAQVLDRLAWFHGVKLPVGGVEQLATLPEYRDAPYERLLVTAAEQSLRDRRAIVAFSHTDRPDAFHTCGWSEAIGQVSTEANVNDVLGALATPAENDLFARHEKPLRIRHWRHVELEPLQHVYRQAAATTWGALDRSEPYWRWLVGRTAHDALIVAVDGPDNWDELKTLPHIVGYAVTRSAQIVELATLPDFNRAAAPLLARACQNAIEHDHRNISLLLPSTNPLHDVLLAANGRPTVPRSRTSKLMLKLLDPARWIESMYDVLLARAKAAGITRPFQVVIDLGRRKVRFDLTRRSGHLTGELAAPVEVACDADLFGALLLGNLDVAAACESGLIEVANDELAFRLAALFPVTNYWQSPLDAP
jgi:predicted acetyltransferase